MELIPDRVAQTGQLFFCNSEGGWYLRHLHWHAAYLFDGGFWILSYQHPHVQHQRCVNNGKYRKECEKINKRKIISIFK